MEATISHKSNSLNDFKSDFSSSAFQTIDGERRILGKYCEITIFDNGIFDVWFIQPNLGAISSQKFSSLEKSLFALKHWKNGTYKRLTGEAYLHTRDRELVLQVAFLAGVKRKRRVTQETRKRCAERLNEIRRRERVPLRDKDHFKESVI